MSETFEKQDTQEIINIDSQESGVDVKKRQAKEKAAVNYAAFTNWLEAQKHTPDFNLPTLKIPAELRSVLIPSKVYELASNTDNLDIVVSQQEGNGVVETLRIVVVEKKFPVQLTDPQIWAEWKDATKRPLGHRGLIHFPLPLPGGINRLHSEYSELIEKGFFGIDDRVLLEVDLLLNKSIPSSLYVSHFNGEVGNGIGSEFYQELLPKFARDLGFRSITGENNAQNISFFTEKLRRKRLADIDENKIPTLFPHLPSGDRSYLTVQFLYPEDIKAYEKHS